jgi:hypothetical protein
MSLPTQIVERLARLNIRPEEIEERFVRGSRPLRQSGCDTARLILKSDARRSDRNQRTDCWRGKIFVRNSRPKLTLGKLMRNKSAKRNGAERGRKVGRKNFE